MISKKYRLTERELRKVLSQKKPFFSYVLIANTKKNLMSHGRCAILLSSKCTKGSVNRNFWRRTFYDVSKSFLEKTNIDVVMVPKKGLTLNYKDIHQKDEFIKNISFLYDIIQKTLKNT